MAGDGCPPRIRHLGLGGFKGAGGSAKQQVSKDLSAAPLLMKKFGKRVIPTLWRRRFQYQLERDQHRRESIVMEAELLTLSKAPWEGFTGRWSTRGMSERVVEVPWVLSRCQSQHRVLDIGSAYGHPVYLYYLKRRGVTCIHGVDLSTRRVDGLTMTRADVRRLPYRDKSFDLIICVSTIEHIGRDNTRYHALGEFEPDGDVSALEEMRRVIADTGRILITVPFGRLEYHDWFKQYDLDAWTTLVSQAGLMVREQAVYAYSDAGWRLAPVNSLPAHGYGELGAPAATAVLCASLSIPR